MKNDYNIPIVSINSITELKVNYHNVLTKISFYLKQNSNKRGKLLVSFHGANNFKDGELMNTPLFRGYNWGSEEFDVLCLSDRVLDDYRDSRILLNWFLDTNKKKYWKEYLNIVEYIFKKFNYKELVFIGTSGGGIPAYRMGSFFNQEVVVTNPQFEIKKYPYFKTYNKVLGLKNDSVEYMGIKELIEEYDSQPKRMTYLCNLLDEHHHREHAIPFVQEIMNKNIDLKLVFFDNHLPDKPNKPHHLIYSPINKTILDYV